jgi:amino acid efflux transporter
MTAGLLVLAWANLVVPLVLAAAAVTVTVVRRLRGRGGPDAAPSPAAADEVAAPYEVAAPSEFVASGIAADLRPEADTQHHPKETE